MVAGRLPALKRQIEKLDRRIAWRSECIEREQLELDEIIAKRKKLAEQYLALKAGKREDPWA
jgi:hypothetical protein